MELRFKNQRVNTGDNNQRHLYPEVNAVVGRCSFRPEQKKSSEENQTKPTNATGITCFQTREIGSSRRDKPNSRRSNQQSAPADNAMPSRCVPSMIGNTHSDSRMAVLLWLL